MKSTVFAAVNTTGANRNQYSYSGKEMTEDLIHAIIVSVYRRVAPCIPMLLGKVRKRKEKEEEYMMFPDRQRAIEELEIADQMNPGAWKNHSYHVAHAAEIIAAHCEGFHSEKAFVCGLLHDIGRRTGIAAVRHIIDGYDYAMSQGWDEVARVCLTHSFPVKNIEAILGKKDISKEQYDFIRHYLNHLEYDDYDKLIILCDALADANGFCILEKRFVDTTRRHGLNPFSVERWNKTYEYKEYFEKIAGNSVYALLPGIEKCIYC